MMKPFTKIINCFQSFFISTKSPILDVWLGFKWRYTIKTHTNTRDCFYIFKRISSMQIYFQQHISVPCLQHIKQNPSAALRRYNMRFLYHINICKISTRMCFHIDTKKHYGWWIKSKLLMANNVNNKPNHDVLSVFSFYFLCRELCLVLFCIHCIEVFFNTWFLNLHNQNLLQKGLKKIYHRIDIYGSRTIAPKENCPPLRIITSRITSPWIIAPRQLPPWKISPWKTTPSS